MWTYLFSDTWAGWMQHYFPSLGAMMRCHHLLGEDPLGSSVFCRLDDGSLDCVCVATQSSIVCPSWLVLIVIYLSLLFRIDPMVNVKP